MASSKHPHCEVIKAWADGAEIQVKPPGGSWRDCLSVPSWFETYDYRVKPEPRPDKIVYRYLEPYAGGGIFMKGASKNTANVKYVFDGETGELKSVEIINGKQ